jgi:valyl-tRNA synthetase
VIYERKIDRTAECTRLRKELEGYEKEIESKERQLSNEQFLSKAPAHVVDGLRSRRQELEILREKTKGKVAELEC